MGAFIIALFVGLINLLYFIVIVKGHPLHPKAQDAIRMHGIRISSEKFAAGVLVYFIGAASLVSWVYFMFAGFDSFRVRASALLPHVVLQLVASLCLLVAGRAVLHAWPRHTTIFFGSIGVVMAVSLISVVSHGGEIHSFNMHVLSVVVQLLGSLFSAAVYTAGIIFKDEGSVNS